MKSHQYMYNMYPGSAPKFHEVDSGQFHSGVYKTFSKGQEVGARKLNMGANSYIIKNKNNPGIVSLSLLSYR